MTDDLTTDRVNQFFPHPVDRAWCVLTTPELMARWLMPNDLQPRPCQRFTLRSVPIGPVGFSGAVACEVLDFIPEERLSISWTDAENPGALDGTVTWSLRAGGARHPAAARTRRFRPPTIPRTNCPGAS